MKKFRAAPPPNVNSSEYEAYIDLESGFVAVFPCIILDWIPLPTLSPKHQDYLSTHTTPGGAAGAVLWARDGGDKLNVILSSSVTVNKVVTRRIRNIKAAAKENGDSQALGA